MSGCELDGRASVAVNTREVSPIDVIEAIIDALDGDGSTGVMPDVTPGHAAVWIARDLERRGWRIVKPIEAEAEEVPA